VHTPLADGLGAFLSAVLGRPLDARALAVIMSVEAEFLTTALEELRRHYGSVDAYLTEVLGVDARVRASLAERLLTD